MHSESFKQHWALSKEDLPLGYNLQKALPAAGSVWIGAWRQSKTIPTNAWASVGVCLRVSACVFLLTAVPYCEAEMTYYPESASGHGRKRIHAYRRRLYRREAKIESNQGPSVWVLGNISDLLMYCKILQLFCVVTTERLTSSTSRHNIPHCKWPHANMPPSPKPLLLPLFPY